MKVRWICVVKVANQKKLLLLRRVCQRHLHKKRLIALILIRVPLQAQLAVSYLDLRRGSLLHTPSNEKLSEQKEGH